jgi:hypothetical protein
MVAYIPCWGDRLNMLLALKARVGDLYIVRKHSLEIDYLLFSCPVVSAEMRGKSQEWRKRDQQWLSQLISIKTPLSILISHFIFGTFGEMLYKLSNILKAKMTGWDQLRLVFISLEYFEMVRDRRPDRSCGLDWS